MCCAAAFLASLPLMAALRVPQATRADELFSRRAAIGALSAAGILLGEPAPPASAIARGGVSWNIDLPDEYVVQRQLASIVRVRLETCLAADDPATSAQVKLICLPFGQQAGASLTGDEQLAVANYFFAPGADASSATEAEAVANVMVDSAARSPTVVALQRAGGVKAYKGSDGRRYVRYGYQSTKCVGELDDGECFGTLAKRRTLATVTMSSLSQFRTNTERARAQELGQVRNVDVLWLLTLSAPDGDAWARLEPTFQRISDSLSVPAAPAA